MFKRLSLLVLPLVLAAGLIMACGDDDDDTGGAGETPTGEAVAVQQTIRDAIAAYGRQDMEAFLSYWTDAGLESEFQASRDELRAVGAEFFEGPELSLGDISDTEVDGDEATSEAELIFAMVIQPNRFTLIREGSAWKIDNLEEMRASIPSDTTRIDVELDEFSFAFDTADTASGNIAFETENSGQQLHEMVIFKLPAGFGLQQFLQADPSAPLPPGLEIIGFGGPWEPGEDGTVVFTQPLASGDYAMVCFLPDENDAEETPHVAKGMAVQFNVTGQGGGR
jgi:hypothetical protein